MNLGLEELGSTLAVGLFAMAGAWYVLRKMLDIDLGEKLKLRTPNGVVLPVALLASLGFTAGLFADAMSDLVVRTGDKLDEKRGKYERPLRVSYGLPWAPYFANEDTLSRKVFEGIVENNYNARRRFGAYELSDSTAHKDVYYVAKNTALATPGYATVLNRIQLRLDFARSIGWVAYGLLWTTVAITIVYILRLLFLLRRRSSTARELQVRVRRMIVAGVGFLGIYIAGLVAYAHESSEYNRHAYGFFATIHESQLPDVSASALRRSTPDPAGDPWGAYFNAVRDASVAEADEISTTLTVIAPWTPGQVWRNSPAGPQVKVVTWANEQHCTEADAAKPDSFTTLPAFVWVSVCPQLQELCRNTRLSGSALDMRLRQMLGLPPDAQKSCFIEYWVAPDDLMRPATDPRVEVSTVPLEPQKGLDSLTSAFLWGQTARAYAIANELRVSGYPWTRLGYTYDWGLGGEGPTGEMGLSEFVIRRGAKVVIEPVIPTDKYCASCAMH